jgi:hypothetical protein
LAWIDAVQVGAACGRTADVAPQVEPREKGQTHEHILNRVVLYLNDQTAAKADDVRMAGAATHAEENTSDQPADRIAVELK